MREFQTPEPQAEARQEFRPASVKAAAEPLAFSAPSLARRTLQDSACLAEPEPAVSERETDEAELSVPIPFEPASATPELQPFRGDWSSAPLGELGLVQLVQRLGASLERRREWVARAGIAAPMSLLTPAAGFDPAPAEEAAQAMAAYFGKPSADPEGQDEVDEQQESPSFASSNPLPNPLASWPTADHDDEDFDVMPSFSLPLRKSVAPTIAFGEPEPENDDEIELAGVTEPDETYSSLLAMRKPFAARDEGFVRVEVPDADEGAVEPAVVFPGHRQSAFAPAPAEQAETRAFDPPAGLGASSMAQAAPPDADAALRAALATLQRMSGTA